MKLIDEIRRDNIDRLQKEYGSLKALAELLGRDESQVSQWKQGSKNSGTGKPRGMRSDTARYIEEKTGKAPGWLDQDHDEPAAMSGLIRLGDESPIHAWEHSDQLPPGISVLIPRLHLGNNPQDLNQKVTLWLVTTDACTFDAETIREDELKPIQLGYIVTPDDSMFPTIERGDKCVVDLSQTQIVDGRTFAIWYDESLRLRRLFRNPNGGLRIEADNQRHPPIEVDAGAVDRISILGRVVCRTGRGGL